MPRSIGAAVRPVSFTITEEQITALDLICERDGINRSEWLRTAINRERLALGIEEGETHNHLPITPDPKARTWWVRLGKDNPNPYNREPCPVCWPEGVPKKRVQWGVEIWTFPDGTEVRN
jgi:hypothetical protein